MSTQGIRLGSRARLGNARLPPQIDIGFGDAITPGPLVVTYPTLEFLRATECLSARRWSRRSSGHGPIGGCQQPNEGLL